MRAVEEPFSNSHHVLGRNARFHNEHLANPLMPVMNAFIIARLARKAPTKHVLKNDIPRLHHAAVVAYTCSGLTGP